VFAYARPKNYGPVLGLIIVADGIGGHKAGEVASQMAIETIYSSLKYYLESDQSEATLPTDDSEASLAGKYSQLANKLRAAVENANNAIHNHAQENPEEAGNLGSTVTCAIIQGNQMVVANVGDSRAYLFHNGELEQITEDHSYVAELIKQGLARPDAVYNHPHRNVITRSLGYESEVEIDIYTCSLEADDRILICSDGLWEMIIEKNEIAELMNGRRDIQKAAQALIARANEYGGGDNIGVALAELIDV
ncbi:MAG: serine/threonine-protein phosphatase, partial [Anaerolineales bacterium]|nr:serine/threonine-protein phosphatase [Anaerolineales bacterium]